MGLKVERTTMAHIDGFIPVLAHRKYYHYMIADKDRLAECLNNSAWSAINEEDGEVLALFGGVEVGHNTTEVSSMFSINAKDYMIQLVKLFKKTMIEKKPEHITRFEAHCELHDRQALGFATKLFGFSIIGVRSKLGVDGADIVLLEKLV